jgi:hypothetical protein
VTGPLIVPLRDERHRNLFTKRINRSETQMELGQRPRDPSDCFQMIADNLRIPAKPNSIPACARTDQ